MSVTIALAGDTMLGRGVAEHITATGTYDLFSEEVQAAFAMADLRVLNLECCMSARGRPREAMGRPFHFRAPPAAVDVLTCLGADCVTLANNHSLDFGRQALEDTLDHLRGAGIQTVGAGRNRTEARTPAVLRAQGMSIAVIGVTDHPADYAAGPSTPGVAHAPLSEGVPDWLRTQVSELAARHDAVLVTPHWGPNMTQTPLPYVREAANDLVNAGATLIAGHSAHVFHGVHGRILYDLGDLIDDYAIDETLRNDLSLLFLATITKRRDVTVRAVPLRLEYAHTRQANKEERNWIKKRLKIACTDYSAEVTESDSIFTITQTSFDPR